MLRIKIWIETEGIRLIFPISKILKQREYANANLSVWQLEKFDDLIPMTIPICKLTDKDILLVCELDLVEKGKYLKKRGFLKLFDDLGVMKSGLNPFKVGNVASECDDKNCGNVVKIEEIFKLEERLYTRKSRQVPNWHIQLMKDRLKEIKEEFCNENVSNFIVNLIIPIPSHPLKLNMDGRCSRELINFDLCTKDVIESQADSVIKRRNPKLFSDSLVISNGDLRALHGILQRGFGIEGVPVDAANLLWNHREYLSRKFPTGIVCFVQSVQWWLSASDPTEIDEAFRVIENWKFPDDSEIKMEIAVMLLVGMCKLNGLADSEIWLNLFEKLIVNPDEFGKKHQSTLILFLSSRETESMEKLREFLKKRILFRVDDGELYWRLKTMDEVKLFAEYKATLEDTMYFGELKKQERLFESIEEVLIKAQKLKGPRLMKLELLKRLLGDPESGVPSACQQCPQIPGLQQCDDNRVIALVPDRTNLFKSTAFTVLLMFLRPTVPLSLPLIFKRGDDLRKDAACLRVFRAIWDIWLKEGGLKLFPRHLLYGVTAIKKDFGLVEFVESVPLSKIVDPNVSDVSGVSEWSIFKYLTMELSDPEATTNFLPSCVGFSLLSYLLGIGDRHLDNLLLTPHGHLLHIDFSFVFGADPKPFPPPIKITREMIRGFETETSSEDKWNEFKGLCFTAQSLLRRKTNLILAILQSEYPNSPETVSFVQERLSMLTSQAEALQKLDKLLEESRVAMFPQVMETIHKWVQYWKS